MGKPIIHYLFRIQYALIFVVVGLVLYFTSTGNKAKATESASWPTVKGVVMSSKVTRAFFVIDSDFAKRGRAPNYYKAKISYRYEVDGETYTSDNVSFMSNYIHRKLFPDVTDIYKEGNHVQIYYDPNEIEDAVLIAGVQNYNKNPHFLTGIILFVLGFIGMIACAVNRFLYRLDESTEH